MPPRGNSPLRAKPAAATTVDGKHYVPPSIVPEHKVPKMGESYVGFFGNHFLGKPLLARLNWLHVPLLFLTPCLGIYGLLTWTFNWKTMLVTWLWYNIGGFGITAGYHRLFAHRAFEATPFARFVLLMMGTAAVEGSARWWCRDHRAHHRYVDTDLDPYSASKGFWFSHVGWMLVKQEKERIGKADISDLNEEALMRWQHKWYLPLALWWAFLFPCLVCGLGWGDYFGGLFIGGFARLAVVHHSTFFVNSLAHWAGAATYTDGHTARNHWVTALLTLGEGYHNFHHEFPSDYRNGIEWYQYDPTKIFIRMLAALGFAYNLKQFPRNEIEKGKLQMKQKKLDEKKAELCWGPDPATLPIITSEELQKRVSAGEKLCILDGFIVDVSSFAPTHPGGEELITKTNLGKDITDLFRGKSYKHSNAARNLAATLRVARLKGYWS